MKIAHGDSVIIHAETGSGKTFAMLLPLLHRLVSHGLREAAPCSLVITAPTRELSLQLFREVVKLLPGCDNAGSVLEGRPLAQLLEKKVSHGRTADGLDLAPIVVGTAKDLAEYLLPPLRRGKKDETSKPVPFQVLVMDEIDRLLLVPGKYSTVQEQERRRRHPRPALRLLEYAVRAKTDIQVIACSATVGRNLRRELGRVVSPEAVKNGIALVRSTEEPPSDTSSTNSLTPLSITTMTVPELKAALTARGTTYTSKERKATLAARLAEMTTADLKQTSIDMGIFKDKSTSRAVVIPPTITHQYIPCRTGDLESKVQALLIALSLLKPIAPLVFLPAGTRVDDTVRALQRSGFPSAAPLHVALERGDLARLYRDKQLVRRSTEKSNGALPALPILVASEGSARGLHLDGVDVVFVLSRPVTPDEYLHLAGRTGRCGTPGKVVSVMSYTESKSLLAWSKQLNFEVTKLQGITEA